ncbi:hemin uptake protein HemP [Leeia aquatica]|nr:hemin uptake protein HemP [Leeia aquatica]
MKIIIIRDMDQVRQPQVNTQAPATRPALPMLDSKALFAASREVLIEHRGERYLLRWTRNDKLILTKVP